MHCLDCRRLLAVVGFTSALWGAAAQAQIPVMANVLGQGEVEIGSIAVNDNGGAGGGITATFTFDPNFAFLDHWYTFHWLNMETGYELFPPDCGGGGQPACGPQATDPVLGTLPAIDPVPGNDPNDNTIPFNDPAPFYFTPAQVQACAAGLFGQICVPKVSYTFSDNRNDGTINSIITFETYLVIVSDTDPGIDPMTVMVTQGFEWTYTNLTGAQVNTLSIIIPSVAAINTALGNANPPGFAGWTAVDGADLSECEVIPTLNEWGMLTLGGGLFLTMIGVSHYRLRSESNA